jgi:hypothetical protein
VGCRLRSKIDAPVCREGDAAGSLVSLGSVGGLVTQTQTSEVLDRRRPFVALFSEARTAGRVGVFVSVLVKSFGWSRVGLVRGV